MPPPPQFKGKGKSSKYVLERPSMTWRRPSLEDSTLILSVVKEAATFAPFTELKSAACVALMVLQNIRLWISRNNVKENKEAYERLGDDSAGLIVVIWRSYKKAEVPEEWLSEEMREILEDLTHTLENICFFVEEQLSRSKAVRVIFSKADSVKINQYRDELNYAMQKFELQSHMNINEVLVQLLKKNEQLSEQILSRNEDEEVRVALESSARDASDRELAEKLQKEELEILKEYDRLKRIQEEQLQVEEARKIEKGNKDLQSTLEPRRATGTSMEMEQRIAEMRRKLAAEQDKVQSATIRGESSRKTQNFRKKATVEDEEEGECEVNFVFEAATSAEEDESDVGRTVRKNSGARRNPSKLATRHVLSEEESTATDDDDVSVRFLGSSKKTAHKKLSRSSLREEKLRSTKSTTAQTRRSPRVEDTDDEEAHAPPSRKNSPKVTRKSQSSSHSLPQDMDDFVEDFEGFSRSGGSKSRSRARVHISGIHSNPCFQTHGISFSPPLGPYGYNVDLPGLTINSGIGNIVNTSLSNIGNDNSVNKFYRK